MTRTGTQHISPRTILSALLSLSACTYLLCRLYRRVMALDRLEETITVFTRHPLAATIGGLVVLAIMAYSPARLLGIARTSYYHAPHSLQLALKGGKKVTFVQVCKSIIPPCRLNPFLINGHFHTIWTLMKGKHVPTWYRRHIFEAEDPTYTGTFAVDFVVKSNSLEPDETLPPRTTYYSDEEFHDIGSDDHRPMLVVLHGLSGGSHELYLREVLAPLTDAGWEACVVNSRGCAMTTITSSVLYNARATWDIRQTVKWLKRTFPKRALFGIGFSLGANIITNYLGEEGADCPLKAAMVLSNVWNNEVAALGLQRTWFRQNVYNKALGQNMKKLFEMHIDQISKNPKINLEKVRSVKYLNEFDRYVQGPTWGYPTEGAYYRDASSVDALLGIRIPFLGISAEDDPVVIHEALPYEEVQVTPYVVLCTTSLGGHLGWFELGGGRWFVKATTNFFQKIAREVDLDSCSREELDVLEGQVSRQKREPLKPVFNPTRRKLAMPAE